ncbi:MAG: hypothetical protein MUP98_02615 [Candidatus Aminicenantes bacterium]|nr:hypothetical protein [Candidatus Aminicenantes bacterium]
MKFKYLIFIFIFLICFIAFSCAPLEKKEIDPARAWAIKESKATKATATLVAKFIAFELSLDKESTKTFVDAYVDERIKAGERQEEVRTRGDRQFSIAVSRVNEQGFLRVINKTLSPDQRKQAINIMRPDGMLGGSLTGSLDGSVNRLIRGKVGEKKIMKAMPILVKYLQQFVALNAKAISERISREERMDMVIELRMATAKKLVSIIGEDAAEYWLDLQTR